MATAVQIKLTLDSAGVVQGLTNVKSQIAAVGPAATIAGNQATNAFNGIESAERRAHVAGLLLNRTLGIEMPRALETVISRSATLGPLLAGAFNVAVFASAASAIGRVYDKIISISEAAAGYTEDVKRIYAETVKASQEAFLNPKTLEIAQRHLQTVNDEIGFLGRVNQAEVSRSQSVALAGTLEEKIVTYLGYGLITKSAQAGIQAKINVETEKTRVLNEKIKELTDQALASLEKQAALAGLKGSALIAAQKQQALNDLHAITGGAGSVQNKRGEDAINKIFGAQATELAHQNAEKRIQEEWRVFDARRKIEEETQAMVEKGVETQLSGDDAIYHEQQMMVDKARALYFKETVAAKTSTAEKVAAWKLYEATVVTADLEAQAKLRASHEKTAQEDAARLQALTSLQERAAEDTKTAQENAALAVVPAWQKAGAQIQIELNRRYRAIQDEEIKALAANKLGADAAAAIEQDAQAKRLEAWTQADERIRQEQKHLTEQLGSELESVFNDISSGKIGQTILNNMKKMFFQILAQWLLTTKMMGSGFGNIFGSLVFGPGSTGAGVFGGGAGGGLLGGIFGGGTPGVGVPGSPGSFFGGSTASAAGFGNGGLLGGSFGGSTSAFGGASIGTGGSVAAPDSIFGSFNSANALTTQSVSTALGIGGAGGDTGGLAAPKLGASLGGLFSANSLLGIGAALPSLLGGKLGGGIGQIGGIISSLSIMAALNPTGAAAKLLSGLGLSGGIAGTLFAAAGPALLGFGLGQNFGPLGGALIGGASGFATGALIGLAGGPIGALIGGIVGAIAGLFGGLFGGSKRRKQANNYYDQQIGPAIKQIVAQYEGFQLDYANASGQLEQLRTQAHDQLYKLHGEGKSVFKDKVSPAIDAAERQIGVDEKERTRRMGLVFGPPQFHDGGFVSSTMSAYMAKPNELLALLKPGEFVVNQRGTANHRGTLEAINNGGAAGTTVGAINIYPTRLDQAYVRSGDFRRDVLNALRSAENEGHSI